MDYILNSQKYFHATYVMDYMAITYFYSLKIFLWDPRNTVKTYGLHIKFSHPREGLATDKGPSERATDQPGNYIAITKKNSVRIFLCNPEPIITYYYSAKNTFIFSNSVLTKWGFL